jgi:hypothetical protein
MAAEQKLKTQTKTQTQSFASKVELFAFGLKNCNCALDRPTYAKMRRAGPDNTLRFVTSETFIEKITSETQAFDGGIKYELVIKEKGEKLAAINIECVFLAHFHGPGSSKKEKIESFLKSYMPILSWPYFRQFVSDTTAKMAIPPVTLPLFSQGSEAIE